jgi:hypothetical protein
MAGEVRCEREDASSEMAQVSEMKPGAAKSLRWFERRMTGPLIAVCLYEAVALSFPSPARPPVSALMHHHRKWAVPAFCGALALHAWFYEGDKRA